jgi:hypothetical protein
MSQEKPLRSIFEFQAALAERLPERLVRSTASVTIVYWSSTEIEAYAMTITDANRVLAAKASEGSGAIDEGM